LPYICAGWIVGSAVVFFAIWAAAAAHRTGGERDLSVSQDKIGDVLLA
jgi:hypothetical protein